MKDLSDELVKDPVCGMVKPKSQMKEQTFFEGKAYYFCSKMDKDMFLAHPKNWVPRE